MARDRRDIADREGAARTATSTSASSDPSVSTPPPGKALAGTRPNAQHHDQLLALIRALARDAARADHVAERGAPDD